MSGTSLWLGTDTGPHFMPARTFGLRNSASSAACESPRKRSSLSKAEKFTRVAVKNTP